MNGRWNNNQWLFSLKHFNIYRIRISQILHRFLIKIGSFIGGYLTSICSVVLISLDRVLISANSMCREKISDILSESMKGQLEVIKIGDDSGK